VYYQDILTNIGREKELAKMRTEKEVPSWPWPGLCVWCHSGTAGLHLKVLFSFQNKA
jgi:hypothetical protein